MPSPMTVTPRAKKRTLTVNRRYLMHCPHESVRAIFFPRLPFSRKNSIKKRTLHSHSFMVCSAFHLAVLLRMKVSGLLAGTRMTTVRLSP